MLLDKVCQEPDGDAIPLHVTVRAQAGAITEFELYSTMDRSYQWQLQCYRLHSDDRPIGTIDGGVVTASRYGDAHFIWKRPRRGGGYDDDDDEDDGVDTEATDRATPGDHRIGEDEKDGMGSSDDGEEQTIELESDIALWYDARLDANQEDGDTACPGGGEESGIARPVVPVPLVPVPIADPLVPVAPVPVAPVWCIVSHREGYVGPE